MTLGHLVYVGRILPTEIRVAVETCASICLVLFTLGILVVFFFLILFTDDLDLFTFGVLICHGVVAETHCLVNILVAVARIAKVIVVIIVIVILDNLEG